MYGKIKSLFIRNSYQIVMTVLAILSGFGLMEVFGLYLPPKFRLYWFISRGCIPLKHPIGSFDKICRICVDFLVDWTVCRKIFNSKEEGNGLCFYFHIFDLIFIKEFYQSKNKGYIFLLHSLISVFDQIF